MSDQYWTAVRMSRRQIIIGISSAAALAACGSSGSKSSSTTAKSTGSTAGGSSSAATTAAATPGTSAATTPATTAAAAGAPKKGGTLRLGVIGSTKDIMDGQYIVNKADQARMVGAWETLARYNDKFEVVTDECLAESIESKAADNYIVHLRQGVTWHDGKPVTADDVVYSFNRLIDKNLNLAKPLQALLDTTGITKRDDHTVEFKLTQGVVTFKDSLAAYAATIVPQGYTRDGKQVGSGPFKVVSFTPGSESVHQRNESYWIKDKPYLDEVRIVDFADATALVNALTGGDVDAIADVPFAQVSTISSNTDLSVLESQAGSFLVITMAVDQEPFTDKRVRQAMRLIADRDEMLTRVLSGHGTIANDLYSPLDACYQGKVFSQRKQNIEEAMKLLKDAGKAGMSIDLFAPDDTAGLPELAAVFADQAKKAGITVNARTIDGATYWGDEYTKRTFATSFWGTRPYLLQVAAGNLHDATYPETHWPPAGSTFADEYKTALAEIDDAKRCDLIKKMQQEEYDDGGNLIPFFNNLLDAHSKKVMGLVARPNILNLDHFGRGFRNIWLA